MAHQQNTRSMIRLPSPWDDCYLKTLKYLKTCFKSGVSVTEINQACKIHPQLHHSIIGLHEQPKRCILGYLMALRTVSEEHKSSLTLLKCFFKVKSKAKLLHPCFEHSYCTLREENTAWLREEFQRECTASGSIMWKQDYHIHWGGISCLNAW